MHPSDSARIQQQLRFVERRLYATVAAWMCGLALLVWLGPLARPARSQAEVVRGRAVEIVDAAGRIRITLDAVNSKPSLWLYDDAGHRRLGLAVGAFGTPEIMLADAQGATRIGLSVGLEHAAEIRLTDMSGRPRIGLWVGYSAEPGLWFFDNLARPRIGLKVIAEGTPRVWLFDHPTGRVLFSAP